MKNILAIAALCFSGTQALKLTAESQSQVEVAAEWGCCGGKDKVCCTKCQPCVCQSAEADFSTGQDIGLMTYTGVTSVNESPFWDTIQNTPFGMKAYQYYVNGIKLHQDEMCDLQHQIEVLLAELNYQETLKDDVEEYELMIKLLIWINECPQYATYCPIDEETDPTSSDFGTPNDDLCAALDDAGDTDCKASYEDIFGGAGSCPDGL